MSAIIDKEFSVPLDSIEKYIGCKAEAFSMQDLIRLKKVYRSLKDGMSKREDYFDLGIKEESSEVKDVFDEPEPEKKEDGK